MMTDFSESIQPGLQEPSRAISIMLATSELVKCDGTAYRGSSTGKIFLDQDPQIVDAGRGVKRERNSQTGRR